MINKLQIPPIIEKFATRLNNAGHECWLVGGAIRDLLNNVKKISDFDFATDARPEQVNKIYKHVIPTGIKHGTVTVLYQGTNMEVTTFRTETDYIDGRHPNKLMYSKNIKEDLSRRDFTINGIALNIITGEILDPFGGISDIKLGIIRTIGKPHERFSEDGLRLFRACRFAAQLKFQIHEPTLIAIRDCLSTARHVSKERIKKELEGVLLSNQPSIGLKLLRKTGLIEYIFPKLNNYTEKIIDHSNSFSQFDHCIKTCDATPINLLIRLATLFHNANKSRNMPTNDNLISKKAPVSAKEAYRTLKRLRFSNVICTQISQIIKFDSFKYDIPWSDAAIRQLIAQVGIQQTSNIFLLHQASHYSLNNNTETLKHFEKTQDQIKLISSQNNASTIKDLAINGDEVMKYFNLKQGPIIGQILTELINRVIENPSLNYNAKLLQMTNDYLVTLEKKPTS